MGGCTPSQLRSLISPLDNEKPNFPKKLSEDLKREPHRFQDIMKEVDDPVMKVLNGQFYSGIFLSKKKYWVENETMNNCFMLFARSLTFAWGEDRKKWDWVFIEETSDVKIEVPILLGVHWLEIYGKLEISYLTPYVTYEVVFVVMMKEPSSCVPLTLKLELPDGSVVREEELSQESPREQWIELRVGEFMVKSNQEGEMKFSLFHYGNQEKKELMVKGAKKGLMVKGVIIRPKKQLI